MQGLNCIIVQECYDSHGVGQPEIVEKARKCEALGAEVVQLTSWTGIVLLLPVHHGRYRILQRFPYSPFGIAGVETLGYEIATQCREKLGKDPDVVVCTNAGGGMVTGTARGLLKAGRKAEVVAASIDLTGLSMASDVDFNKKSLHDRTHRFRRSFMLPIRTTPTFLVPRHVR